MTEYSGPRCTKPGCGGQFVDADDGIFSTLVGYSSPPGHNHDDNCLKRVYICEHGHKQVLALRRRCSRSDCDWVGKEECFCHDGEKVDQWPVAAYPREESR